MRSCIMPGLLTHLVQELNVGTVYFRNMMLKDKENDIWKCGFGGLGNVLKLIFRNCIEVGHNFFFVAIQGSIFFPSFQGSIMFFRRF